MTEISFAKSFLASLNTYPTRIPLDHVDDPKKYPLRATFSLPKHTQPQLKKRKPNSGTISTVNVHLKLQRNPPMYYDLSSQPLNKTIMEIKITFSEMIQAPTEKIKLLHNKKPVADSKQLKDLLFSNSENNDKNIGIEETLDLGVMIL
ncbi:putative ubiquitin-like protein [Erysiphe neolycopersici]|uniref:Putative ubiquitin-like protein n=1 Tax=Erysiphe neolycopersici TaxID=212602 RepID=A0A420HRM2_9PEZI|nr:putative ubiquitin-like protein [Erysiphe neolycopersici]